MSDRLAATDLAAIEARCAKTTPGEWALEFVYANGRRWFITSGGVTVLGEPDVIANSAGTVSAKQRQANMRWAARAHTDLPRLTAEVRRLRTALAFYADPDMYDANGTEMSEHARRALAPTETQEATS